jgi:hypothetical protein
MGHLRTIMLVAAALGLGACSSVSNLLDSSSADKPQSAGAPAASPSSSSTGLLSGIGVGSPTPASGEAALKPEDYPCPEVTVRPGAGTLLLGSKSSVGEIGAMDLRYQGTLVKFARECMPRAGIMTMKIGIEGRIITGPAGGPGTVEVPLRLAVVQEGPDPKTVVSKLARIPVTVGEATPNVDFTHVDQDVAFPIPRPMTALGSYIVYVGFDPAAATPQKPPPRKRKR